MDAAIVQHRLKNGLCPTCGNLLFRLDSKRQLNPIDEPGMAKNGLCLICRPQPSLVKTDDEDEGQMPVESPFQSFVPTVLRDREGLEYVNSAERPDRFVHEYEDGQQSAFEGSHSHGMFNGHGVQWDAVGCEYRGEFENGASHGYGSCKWPEGWMYFGQWAQDERHGTGTCWQQKEDGERYTGEWWSDKWHGFGVLHFAGGGKYVGSFRESKIHGHGQYLFKDNSCYIGEFSNDIRVGKGVMTYADRSRYDGEWEDNWRHGRGTMFYPNGDKFEGTFEADSRWNGTLTRANGSTQTVRNGTLSARIPP